VSVVSRMLRPITLVATAGAGLVGAHALDYMIVLRDGASRHHTLVSTGHGYFSDAVVLAVAAGVVAMLSSAFLGYRRGTGRSDRPVPFAWLAARLSLLQVAGFILLELGERAAAGAPLDHLTGPLMAAGLLLQVAVAIVGAGVLVLLGRAAELIGSGLAARWAAERSPGYGVGPADLRLAQTPFARPGQVRAPPLPLVPQP
jgi:hypothetical protein